VDRFPNREKFALCTTIKNHCYAIIQNIIDAGLTRKDYERHQKFNAIDRQIEFLRFLINHAHERTYLAHHSFETSAKKVDEIGRILGRLLNPVKRPDP